MKTVKQILEEAKQLERQALLLDTDYWLDSLFVAIQDKDTLEIAKCKEHLKRIQEENSYV